MDILLVIDDRPTATRYQESICQALVGAWTSENHRVQVICGPEESACVEIGDFLDSHKHGRVHILSTGPIARLAASLCRDKHRPYTSTSDICEASPHSIRHFRSAVVDLHVKAQVVVTPSTAARDWVTSAGVGSATIIPAGVDTTIFQPRLYDIFDYKRPITLALLNRTDNTAMRQFIDAGLPGTKLIYAPAWTGTDYLEGGARVFSYLNPSDLANLISAADTCLVPERGPEAILLTLQSLACGVPVAAQDARYTADILNMRRSGAIHTDFGRAVSEALGGNRQLCRSVAKRFSWRVIANRILNLSQGRGGALYQSA